MLCSVAVQMYVLQHDICCLMPFWLPAQQVLVWLDVEPDVCRPTRVCGAMGRHRVASVACNVVVVLYELLCTVRQVMLMFVNGAGYSRASSETGCVQVWKWIRYKERHRKIGEVSRAV